jgi:N-acetylneuraminic acid mutarotase
MHTARAFAQATLLRNGLVLVSGGESGNNIFSIPSAELYDPQSDSWSVPGGPSTSMTPRSLHTATLLNNGQVLVAGGMNNASHAPIASVQLYDPVSNKWSNAASLPNGGTVAHTATLLNDGRVLVFGWQVGAVIYDPATNQWSPAGNIPAAAFQTSYHTATLLSDGEVLICGGADNNGPSQNCELYDPSTNNWKPADHLLGPHYVHTATLLQSGPQSGKVLLAGGWAGSSCSGNPCVTQSTIIYAPPPTNKWSGTDNLQFGRAGHTATFLPWNGTVLAVGGEETNLAPVAVVEEYIPNSSPTFGNWTGIATLRTPRAGHATTLLAVGGEVLVVGGVNGSSYLTSAELGVLP